MHRVRLKYQYKVSHRKTAGSCLAPGTKMAVRNMTPPRENRCSQMIIAPRHETQNFSEANHHGQHGMVLPLSLDCEDGHKHGREDSLAGGIGVGGGQEEQNLALQADAVLWKRQDVTQ
jgi:hypothetical protein